MLVEKYVESLRGTCILLDAGWFLTESALLLYELLRTVLPVLERISSDWPHSQPVVWISKILLVQCRIRHTV